MVSNPKCYEAAPLAWFQEGRAAFVLANLRVKRTWQNRARRFHAQVMAQMGFLPVGDGQDPPLSAGRCAPPCGSKAANGSLRSPR